MQTFDRTSWTHWFLNAKSTLPHCWFWMIQFSCGNAPARKHTFFFFSEKPQKQRNNRNMKESHLAMCVKRREIALRNSAGGKSKNGEQHFKNQVNDCFTNWFSHLHFIETPQSRTCRAPIRVAAADARATDSANHCTLQIRPAREESKRERSERSASSLKQILINVTSSWNCNDCDCVTLNLITAWPTMPDGCLHTVYKLETAFLRKSNPHCVLTWTWVRARQRGCDDGRNKNALCVVTTSDTHREQEY